MLPVKVLDRSTLILNSRWHPVRVGSVREAIALVSKGHARIIEPDTYETHDLLSWNDVSKASKKFDRSVVRSMNLSLIPPEVIVLTEYGGVGARTVVFSRKNLFKRDKHACQYCGVQPGASELTIDHVIPRSKGGISSWENCVLACVECNKRKADLSLEKSGLKLKRAPKKPSWKSLITMDPKGRKESWSAFISRAYWESELQP